MKRRFSFSRLLYNDKLMMLVSLIVAIALWASVLSGPAYVEERSIPVRVTVDLTNTYAYQSGLRIIGDSTFEATVRVSGPWSVVSKLTETDLKVRPDLTSITGAGDVEVPLNVSRNSTETDYDILVVTPATVTVACDYWQEGTAFRVETDVSSLTVEDHTKFQVGEPVLDLTAIPDGDVTINGPKTTISQIESVVARVTETEVLTEIKQYEAPLIALDKDGNSVDLTHCEFEELPTGKIKMTVPIWEERHVDIGYTVQNAPSGFDLETLLTAEPSGIDLLGPSAELDTLEEQLTNLGNVNFAKLSLVNDVMTFPLTIPSTVRAIDSPTSVTVTLNKDGLAQKTMEIKATDANTVAKGTLGDLKMTVPEQTLESVLLIGNASAINAITEAALSLQIDFGEAPTVGTKQYTATVRINGYDDVWVYYGTDKRGVTIYATLS